MNLGFPSCAGVLALCLLHASESAAAPAAPGSPASAIGTPSDSESLRVEIETTGPEVDAIAVEQAIARELSRTGSAGRSAHVTLSVEPEQVTVSYRDASGSSLSRSVAAPARADELPELVALIVANMARDDATGLVDELERTQTPAPAAPPQAEVAREPASPLASSGFNFSVWHPMTLQSHTEQRRLHFELGVFYSRLGALAGVGITPGFLSVGAEASGASIAGVGYWHGGAGAGARIAGVVGIAGESFEGAAIAGAFNLQRGPVTGAQIAGTANVAAHLEGAQIGGAVNVVTERTEGAQLGGTVNVTRNLNGMQFAAVNVSDRVRGLQIGVVNVAGDVEGVQLGIVNVARDVDGVSLGLVPYVRQGRVQAVAWYDSKNPGNLGVRFQNGPLYVMPTLSYIVRDGRYEIERGGASYAPGFSLGGRLSIAGAFIDLDANYSSPSDGWRHDEHAIDLRYRLLAGYEIVRGLGLFAGGGVRHHFRTKGPSEESVDPVFCAGVQLL